jgi:hypothetical protein
VTVENGELSFDFPAGPDELTVAHVAGFYDAHGRKLDDEAAEIEQLEDATDKEIRQAFWVLERAFSLLSFFAGISIEEAKQRFTIQEAQRIATGYDSAFANPPEEPAATVDWQQMWVLPPPYLAQDSAMTFGEFIDSKAKEQEAQITKCSRWYLIQQVAAIFLRAEGEAYDESLLYPGSQRVALMGTLPIRHALHVAVWFEKFNAFVQNHFALFAPSDSKTGHHMKNHMDKWGWVNLLKTVAKAKVFDRPASDLDSVKCARLAKAFDVLLYASEEKDYSDAMNRDMKTL